MTANVKAPGIPHYAGFRGLSLSLPERRPAQAYSIFFRSGLTIRVASVAA